MNVVTDLVKSEILILLSKGSMKKAGRKIDFVKEKSLFLTKRLVCYLHKLVFIMLHITL